MVDRIAAQMWRQRKLEQERDAYHEEQQANQRQRRREGWDYTDGADLQREEDPFDLAVSQLGVMFFDEPKVAFSAIRGALVPGGRLVFACWQGVEHNPWHVRTLLRHLLPPAPVPGPGKSPVGPFALGDDEYTGELLESAGFGAVERTAHEVTVRAPASAVFDRTSFELFGVPPEREDEALGLIERQLQQFAIGPDEYEYPLAFRIFRAVNP